MNLIDKSALVAELKKRIRDYWSDSENTMGIYPYALEEVIKYVDTLEVKEVDLKKELDYNDYLNFFIEHPNYNNIDWGFDECWVFAKHFFELGLKASNPLTWEDIKAIDKLLNQCVDYSNRYQEVLKRFKDMKKEVDLEKG